jgi:hypothetical protein
VYYGERLERHMTTRAGDLVYFPANVAHLPYNLSTSEPASPSSLAPTPTSWRASCSCTISTASIPRISASTSVGDNNRISEVDAMAAKVSFAQLPNRRVVIDHPLTPAHIFRRAVVFDLYRRDVGLHP